MSESAVQTPHAANAEKPAPTEKQAKVKAKQGKTTAAPAEAAPAAPAQPSLLSKAIDEQIALRRQELDDATRRAFGVRPGDPVPHWTQWEWDHPEQSTPPNVIESTPIAAEVKPGRRKAPRYLLGALVLTLAGAFSLLSDNKIEEANDAFKRARAYENSQRSFECKPPCAADVTVPEAAVPPKTASAEPEKATQAPLDFNYPGAASSPPPADDSSRGPPSAAPQVPRTAAAESEETPPNTDQILAEARAAFRSAKTANDVEAVEIICRANLDLLFWKENDRLVAIALSLLRDNKIEEAKDIFKRARI